MSEDHNKPGWAIMGAALLLVSAYLAAGYSIHGVPPGEEESEGVTIKVTATILAVGGISALSFAVLRFIRSKHPSD
jgi:hypothetical protein